MVRIFQGVLTFAALGLLAYIILPFLLLNTENVAGYVDEMLGDDVGVTMSSVSWNPLNREFSAEDINITRVEGEDEVTFLEITNFKFSKIGLIEAINGNLSADHLLIDGFFLNLNEIPESFGDTEGEEGEDDTAISISLAEAKNGRVLFSGDDGGDGEVRGVMVSVAIDYRTDCEECDLYSAFNRFNVSLDTISYKTGDGYYDFAGEDLYIEEEESLIEIASLSYKPLKSDEEFLELLDYRTEYFEMDLSGFRIEQFNFDELRNAQDFVAGTILIDSLDLHITSDLRLPEDPEADDPILPHQMLDDLPFRMAFNELTINHADIRYSEYASDGVRPGSILFAGTHTTLENVDNRSSGLATMTTESYLMGQGLLNVEFLLQLGQDDFNMDVKGSVGSFDITLLNEIFIDIEGVVIEDGMINGLVFEYKMTDIKSEGFIEIDYQDLSVDMVDKTDQGQNFFKSLEGFFADQIMIRASSSSSDSDSRPGEIAEDRDVEKGFFNYLWVSLRSGLFDAVMRF